ncbi:MAG: hypothetical protein WD648_02855 [Planctomycetaceae bacterium]
MSRRANFGGRGQQNPQMPETARGREYSTPKENLTNGPPAAGR